VIDSHTGASRLVLVLSGGSALGGALCPRGCGAFATNMTAFGPQWSTNRGWIRCDGWSSSLRTADASWQGGVIFFNNVGYLGMCGHGTIGLVCHLAAPWVALLPESIGSKRP